MTAVGYKTVVEFIPLEISDAAADFYSESISCCPKWLQHAGCMVANAFAILITPLAMACDLVAAMVFKCLACCCTESKDEYNEKAWEYFKSGTAGGSLFICLAIMRLISPGHAGAAPRTAPTAEAAAPPPEREPAPVVVPTVESSPPQQEPVAAVIPPAGNQNLAEAPPPQQETA